MENKIECAYCQTKDKSPLCSIPQAVSEIDKIKVVTKHSSGDAIFRVGDFPLGLYSIQTGLVKIESTSPQGNNLTLRLVGPGGAIGYRSLFADEA